MFSLFSILFALPILSSAAVAYPPTPAHAPHLHAREPAVRRRLPSTWYQPNDHPAHALFRRDSSAPSPGSPAWVASFPASTPAASDIPQAWLEALNAAVAAGDIPDVPQTTESGGQFPAYPKGMDPMSSSVCSATYKCRIDGDVWDAPDGVFGVGFDDGPIFGSSAKLYSYLQSQNQSATHFMIGVNILNDLQDFETAFSLGHDIAVHTWTHPYMTTLTNEQLVAQFGFSMKAISELTGGRLPRYWRPPYGDTDHRVRAIALNVFGLETIIWNQDTEDWSLTINGTTPAIVAADLQKWITGPKSPGLIILEHELSDLAVTAFINAYPSIKQNGWNPISVTAMTSDMVPYRNADDDFSPVTSAADVILSFTAAAPTSSSNSPGPAAGNAAASVLTASPTSSSVGAAAQAVSTKSAAPSGTPKSSAHRLSSIAPVVLSAGSFLAAIGLLA